MLVLLSKRDYFHLQIILLLTNAIEIYLLLTSVMVLTIERKKYIASVRERNTPYDLCIKKFFDVFGLISHFNAKHPDALPDAEFIPPVSLTRIILSRTFIHRNIPSSQFPLYQLKRKICEVFRTH